MAARKKSRKKTTTPPLKTKGRQASRKAVQKRVSKPAKKTMRKQAVGKAKKVAPIPEGFHTITASLCFQDAAFAMGFYENAFGAKELFRLAEPNGRIGHAEMRIGDSIIMMSDEYPDMGILSAKTMGGSPIRLSIVVKNPDAMMEKAIAAGATIVRPLHNEFYGWRSGVVMDPFGYSWFITCQVEHVSPQEMQDRWTRMLAISKTEGNA